MVRAGGGEGQLVGFAHTTGADCMQPHHIFRQRGKSPEGHMAEADAACGVA